ncbi:MAG: hypothetical protein ACD_11C00105G0016 [uncultured bacterium]|nr:MAG: hypothetical protein ACD_11C00105G0016 [uncultured bacterium]HBR71367.1 hypothetical protein [Candidatus Moranbacteria bacterium]
MDKKSKIFFAVFFLLIAASVAATYYRIMIKKDYVIEAQTDCDPYAEECFVWECDPESDVEGEACVEDPEENIWYFKVVRRNASQIPLCDPNTDETCDPWTCEAGEADCEDMFCSEDQLEAQYASRCIDPVIFAEENPIEEEETIECEEGDEECAADEAATEEVIEEIEAIETEESGDEEVVENELM